MTRAWPWLHPAHGRERRAVRHEVAEGLRWLWHHAPIRTLAITIFALHHFGAAMSVYVLYAQERLGVGDLGFGLLLAASAVGGAVGAALRRTVSAVHARHAHAGRPRCRDLHAPALALPRSPFIVAAVMFVFGVHAAVWGSTADVRQRAVPSHLLGRVNSVYMLGSIGATLPAR